MTEVTVSFSRFYKKKINIPIITNDKLWSLKLQTPNTIISVNCNYVSNYYYELLFGSNSYRCFHLSGCPEPSSFWTSSTRTSALLRFVEDGWIGWDRYCILVCLVLSAFQRQTVRNKTNNRNHTANHWSQSLLIDKWESEIIQPVKSAGKWWAPVYDWFSVPFDWLNGRNLSSNWLLEHLCLRFLAAIYARDVRRILWTNHIFVS